MKILYKIPVVPTKCGPLVPREAGEEAPVVEDIEQITGHISQNSGLFTISEASRSL